MTSKGDARTNSSTFCCHVEFGAGFASVAMKSETGPIFSLLRRSKLASTGLHHSGLLVQCIHVVR